MPDMLIPFLVLICMVLWFMYDRKTLEDRIEDIYEDKFQNWKNNFKVDNTKSENNQKELVGLVFLENKKLSIEVIKKSAESKIKTNKFKVKFIEIDT